MKTFAFFVTLLLLVGVVFGCAQTTEETTDSTSEGTESETVDSTTIDEASDDSELDIIEEEDDLGEVI